MRIYFDEQKIAKKLGITEKEVENISLKEIKEIQKELDNKEKLLEIKEDKKSFSLELKKKYFLQYDNYVSVFGQTIIDNILENKIMFRSLATPQWFRDTKYPESRGYVFIKKERHPFEIAHKRASSFTRTEYFEGYEYYGPSSYQSIIGSTITTLCVKAKLKENKITLWDNVDDIFNIYALNSGHDDIYMKTEVGSLYVPIHALFEGEKGVEAIKDRTISYMTSYNGDTEKGKQIANSKKANVLYEAITKK